MNRDEFMELVYETFADEPDNVLANGIIEAADAYAEHEKAQLSSEGTTKDAISRQAALDLVKDVCDAVMSGCESWYDPETGDEVYKDIREVDAILKCNKEVRIALRNMSPAQPEPPWIPVSERLPEDMQYVLLTVRRLNNAYNHEPFISVGYIGWNQHHWWCAHDGDCEISKVEVLAWMPLPKIYNPNK